MTIEKLKVHKPIGTGFDLKVQTLIDWKIQLSKPKIIKVIGKNRSTNVTVRTKS